MVVERKTTQKIHFLPEFNCFFVVFIFFTFFSYFFMLFFKIYFCPQKQITFRKSTASPILTDSNAGSVIGCNNVQSLKAHKRILETAVTLNIQGKLTLKQIFTVYVK